MIFACICGIVALLLLLIDLLTKAWAYFVPFQQNSYFLGIIRLRFLPGGNTGIAWGFLGNTDLAMTIVTAFTAVMIVGLIVLFFTYFKKNRPAQICLAVIVAGAIGNFIDVNPLGFGICNPADFYITFGAVALLIIILFVGKDAVFPLGKYRKMREEEMQKKEESQDATD